MIADSPAADTTLLAIAVVVLVGVLAGRAARRFGQPAVVGEIVAGVLLGPSALGLLPGDLMTRLFTTDAVRALSALGQVGLLVFMFGLGASMDHGLLAGRRRQLTAVAGAGLVLPFLAGIGFGGGLHHWWPPAGGTNDGTLAFLLFLGADMSVTAFPVLARMLAEQRMQNTRLGSAALASAALVDLGAWLLLVTVVAVVRSTGPGGLLRLLLAAGGLVLLTRVAIRPAVAWLLRGGIESVGVPQVSVVFAGVVGTGWLTAAVGFHQVFGGFLFGLAMPRDGLRPVSAAVVARLESIGALLLPLFFVSVGLDVDVRSLSPTAPLVFLAAVTVSGVAKMGGVTVAARWTGETWRSAAAIGVLMNTRGLTELAVLDVGLSLGVVSRPLFAVLVLASIVTTALTTPVLRRVRPSPDAELSRARHSRMPAGAAAAEAPAGRRAS